MANPHPQPHPENLRPCRKGDPATKEKARKGGKKSQEAQIKKRTMREWAQMIGELPIYEGKLKDPKTAQDLARGAEHPANLTMEGQAIAALYGKAAKGDTRAINLLAQLKGQLQEEITVHTDPLSTLTEDQLDAILGAIREARKSDE